MRDVQPFLDEIEWVWRDEKEIIQAIYAKFDGKNDGIADDFRMVANELLSQQFIEIECNGDGGVRQCKQKIDAKSYEDEIDTLPIKEFCRRNGIVAEFHIDLTDACTERCVHCYVPKGQNNYLSTELVEKAIEEFRKANGLTVHLTGGEAMMHPDFERICRKCVGLNLNIVIFSNMTLCDDRRIAFLKDIQPQYINVSLYSMRPQTHDAITQLPGSWRRTMDAILKCCKAGVHCRIATPLLKNNWDAIPSLRKFAEEHYMHLVPAIEIVAQSDHGCENLSYACSEAELRRALIDSKEVIARDCHEGMPSCDANVCAIGSRGRLYLNATGEYYPCDSMHRYVLGNVRENTFEEIWKGEKLNYLRSLKNRDFGACASCQNRPWCKVCPAANFNATGDLFTHHPNTCVLAGVIREVYGNGLNAHNYENGG